MSDQEKKINEKVASPYSITESPENFFFVAGIILAWLWYQQTAILSWKHPTIIMTYWFLIFALIIVIIIALWFYSKILADVFLKPENFSKQTVIKTLKWLFKWSLIIYVYIFSGDLSVTVLTKLVEFFFFYY